MIRESSNQGESAYFSLVDACTRTGPALRVEKERSTDLTFT